MPLPFCLTDEISHPSLSKYSIILSVGTNSYLFVIFDDGEVAKIDGAVDLINSGV
jgi:hypothetical protein